MNTEEDTNSGIESKGEAFGLEGNLFLYIVFALMLSLLAFGVCAETGVGLINTIMWVALPWPLTFAYLYAFQINKPPAYQSDYFQRVGGDTFITHTNKDNPYIEKEEEAQEVALDTYEENEIGE